MSNYVRVECTECGIALRITSDKLPTGHQPDELFENFCPGCERPVYMNVSATQQKSRRRFKTPK